MPRAQFPPARAFVTLIALLSVAACGAPRPSQLGPAFANAPVVLVKSLRLPTSEPWITRFAHHSWFDVRESADATWRRIEIVKPEGGVTDVPLLPDEVFADVRWERPVQIRASIVGERARRAIPELRSAARAYDDSVYHSWPGPNSNTFVERMLRRIDGLQAQLHHNAVGKDDEWRIGRSGSGAGVELETPVLGVQIGLIEGIELHLLGLTFGVGIVPLSIKLPFLPAPEIHRLPPSIDVVPTDTGTH